MSFFKDLPLAIAFKSLGVESEQEMVQMIGSEDRIVALFTPCLEECHKNDIFTQNQV